MFSGWATVCLKVDDLGASMRFYEQLGMEVVEQVEGLRVILKSGSHHIALMTFLDENLLNLRCGDVTAIFDSMTRELPALEGAPQHYTPSDLNHGAAAPGTSWRTRDPDGNVIFFDTNRNEEGDAYRQQRVAEILEDAEQDLINAAASAECLSSLREVIQKHGTPS